jgi:hypothetical protein
LFSIHAMVLSSLLWPSLSVDLLVRLRSPLGALADGHVSVGQGDVEVAVLLGGVMDDSTLVVAQLGAAGAGGTGHTCRHGDGGGGDVARGSDGVPFVTGSEMDAAQALASGYLMPTTIASGPTRGST